MQRKIFIDLGAYNGDTIEMFMLGLIEPNPEQFEIYGFEPSPDQIKPLKYLAEKYPGLNIFHKAAWIENCQLEFTVDESADPLGSTLMRSKRNWGAGKIVKVWCFDFDRWIKKFEGDYVVVKMDIEGAEFPLLRKLIASGNIKIISKLWVEFHPNKVTDFTTTEKDELIDQLKTLTEFRSWH